MGLPVDAGAQLPPHAVGGGAPLPGNALEVPETEAGLRLSTVLLLFSAAREVQGEVPG